MVFLSLETWQLRNIPATAEGLDEQNAGVELSAPDIDVILFADPHGRQERSEAFLSNGMDQATIEVSTLGKKFGTILRREFPDFLDELNLLFWAKRRRGRSARCDRYSDFYEEFFQSGR